MAQKILSKLISKVNPQEMFNTIAKGINNTNFTNQERSEINMELYRIQLEFAQTKANGSTVSSKARRALAFMVAIPFLSGKCLAMYLAVWRDATKATHVDQIVNGLAIYFGGIMTFYFGTYIYQKVQQRQNVRKLEKLKDIVESKE